MNGGAVIATSETKSTSIKILPFARDAKETRVKLKREIRI